MKRMKDRIKDKDTTLTGNVLDDFIDGAKRAVNINLFIQIPNFIMAFALIQILEVCGGMDVISKVFTPIMAVFGIPGAGGAILATGFLSTSGAVGAMVALYEAGTLTAGDMAILIPMVFMIGGLIQMIGRFLVVAQIPKKYWAPLFIVCFIGAAFCGWLMKLLLAIM